MYKRAKTMIKRNHKAVKMGATSKRKRENKGTTAQFPLEGDLPALRYGMKVDPASIIVPAELLSAK
jgi:hypothetical protein